MQATRLFCLSLAIATAGALLAQGPLTPPPSYDPALGPLHAVDGAGLPQPTMKTLHQVEPRTPLAAGQPGVTVNANGGFTITAPGSYYLTAGFGVSSGSGIIIQADYVTLDLNGLNIYSYASPASGAGVDVPVFQKGLTVRNGFIVGSTQTSGTAAPYSYLEGGFIAGVSSTNTGAAGSAYAANLENLDVRDIAGTALNVLGGKFRDCIVDGCSGAGISGSEAAGCSVTRCGSDGLVVDLASRCEVGACHGQGMYVTTADQCVVTGCTGIGIHGYHITSCHAFENGSYGIIGQTVTDSSASENDGDGIWTVHARGCIANASGGVGLRCETATDCRADESALTGIIAQKASGCMATRGLGHGFEATIVDGCKAEDNGLAGFYLNAYVETPHTPVSAFSATNCVAVRNDRQGFRVGRGSIRNCSAEYNGYTGIDIYYSYSNIVEGCSSFGNTFGGISISGPAVNCVVRENGTFGLSADIATGCAAYSNGGEGITASVVAHCRAFDNSATGIQGVNISFCRSNSNTGANYTLLSGGVSNFNN